MASLIRLTILTGSILTISSAFATTYYIDFAGGSDANSGTNKLTPWKLCPGMNDAGGVAHTSGHGSIYTHHAGDQFIFKGGVTWPRSCFTMTISTSGTRVLPFTENNPTGYDYYGGGDPSWFTGSSWTRPTFDFGGAIPPNGIAINLTGNSIQIDNIEFVNFAGPDQDGTGMVVAGGQYHMVSNCLFRDWTTGRAIYGGFGTEAKNCEFHCLGTLRVGRWSGSPVLFHDDPTGIKASPNVLACKNVSYIYGCNFHDLCNACLGGGHYHDNHYHDMWDCYVGAYGLVHGNAIEVFSLGDINNNLIHDLQPTIASILMYPADSGPDGIVGTARCYNNVVYNVSQTWGFGTELGHNPRNITAYLCNNTTTASCGVSGGGSPGNEGNRYLNAFVQNNHTINSTATASLVTNSTVSNNLSQTLAQANTAGYTAANNFAPTIGTVGANSTVNAGVTLSFVTTDRLGVARPQDGTYDIGAYEWNGIAPTPTPTPTPAPTPTPTATPRPGPPQSLMIRG